ncbi:MAG: hypothetical protein ACRBC3_21590 [Burkholderiaceae bacterium]
MTWDALWWLILGSLLGWVALWFCDKLFLRDGDVAGMRAERELLAAQNELDLARDQVRRSAEHNATLESDLVASNDQADVLRTELAVVANERTAMMTDLATEKERASVLQREIDSSRKLAAERVEEINRMKQSFVALENERDVAQRWAQGKESEAARLTEARLQTEAQQVEVQRLLSKANHNILAAQRTARLLEARAGQSGRDLPRLHARLRSRMKQLSGIQHTIDALTAADQARRAVAQAEESASGDSA